MLFQYNDGGRAEAEDQCEMCDGGAPFGRRYCNDCRAWGTAEEECFECGAFGPVQERRDVLLCAACHDSYSRQKVA
jgi:hypothetical protein